MPGPFQHCCVAAIGALALSAAAVGQSDTATVDPDQVRAIIAEVMSDAETRSSLLADGATAGHDGKFFLASADGNYRLNIGGDLQLRYYLNYRGDENDFPGANKGDDFNPGFQVARMRLHFDGNIVSRALTYKILTRTDQKGQIVLEEAYTAYALGNGWKTTAGQFKIPLLHEELVSSVKQLAVERSVVNLAFSQSRSQGVQIALEQADWNATAAFSDGILSDNTDWINQSLIASSAAGAPFIIRGQADYAITSRLEYKFAGSWEQYAEFTSKPDGSASAVLGVATQFQQSPNTGDPTNVDRQTFEYTTDLAVKGGGWNIYGMFVGRHDHFRGPGPANKVDFDDFGALVQGGYRWGDNEVYARWDAIIPDGERNLQEDLYQFVTIGFNEYFAGQAAKFTVDTIFSLQETADIAGQPGSAPGAGSIKILPSTAQGLLGSTQPHEICVRFQFQLLF